MKNINLEKANTNKKGNDSKIISNMEVTKKLSDKKKTIKIKKIRIFNDKKNIVIVLLSILIILSFVLNILLFISKHDLECENDENIIFFGDSLIAKYEVNKYFRRHSVVNKGISGNSTEDLIDRIDKDIFEYNPSKVFLLIGINDLARNVEDEDVLLNIATIISDIKMNRGRTEIYVESLYPVNYDVIHDVKLEYAYNLNSKRVQDFNIKLKELCELNGVKYINVFDSLKDRESKLKKMYTYDGLHLNRLGYLKVTSILKEYINN